MASNIQGTEYWCYRCNCAVSPVLNDDSEFSVCPNCESGFIEEIRMARVATFPNSVPRTNENGHLANFVNTELLLQEEDAELEQISQGLNLISTYLNVMDYPNLIDNQAPQEDETSPNHSTNLSDTNVELQPSIELTEILMNIDEFVRNYNQINMLERSHTVEGLNTEEEESIERELITNGSNDVINGNNIPPAEESNDVNNSENPLDQASLSLNSQATQTNRNTIPSNSENQPNGIHMQQEIRRLGESLTHHLHSLQTRFENITRIRLSIPTHSLPLSQNATESNVPNSGDYLDARGLEEFLLRLANETDSALGSPPASKAFVDKLPLIVIEQKHIDQGFDSCIICKEFSEIGEKALELPCKHMYHVPCIKPWLQVRNSCPVCRLELPTDDPDYEQQRRNLDSLQINLMTPEESTVQENQRQAGNSEDSSNVSQNELENERLNNQLVATAQGNTTAETAENSVTNRREGRSSIGRTLGNNVQRFFRFFRSPVGQLTGVFFVVFIGHRLVQHSLTRRNGFRETSNIRLF